MLTYQNLEIEILLEGIICIDFVHIIQRLNEHGMVTIRAVIEAEKALEIIEQSDYALSVRICQGDSEKRVVFCGRTSQIRIENENGLFYLYLDFFGYTKEWDLIEKSQSFLRGNDTYEQVIHKVLSEYGQAQIKDEVTGNTKIPGMLMQYEETDWEFLKRLASHFSTFLIADNTQNFGKVYFGIPHIDYGVVLEEKEYVLFKEGEKYEKFTEQDDIMPQEMINWRIRSKKHLQLGEQIRLGHIEVVVTEIDIYTRQGELVYEYGLSRRKGIFMPRKKNSKIFGMSIPATVKERKGNQVRVQMDIDPIYEAASDLKYFTYAIETSNFYCMPEVGSRVHIYFPEHEEQSAMAVHALRIEKSTSDRSRESLNSSSNSTKAAQVTSVSSSSARSEVEISPILFSGGIATDEKSLENLLADSDLEIDSQKEKQKEKHEEKDPSHKVFSDPGGSFLELSPEGITFAPGGSVVSLMLQSTGMLYIGGLSLSFGSDSYITTGVGKKELIQNIEVQASDTLKIAMARKINKITINENTRIVAEFIKEKARIKSMAMPPASQIKAMLTAGDADMRAAQNSRIQGNLTENITSKLLEEKEKSAKQEIFNGVLVGISTVGAIAAICLSGGTLAPAAIGALSFLGATQLTSATSDIMEGISDLDKVEAGDISKSTNLMRDGFFGGDEMTYRSIMLVNQLVFNVVSGMALTQSLNTASSANNVANSIKSYQAWCNRYPVASVTANVIGDSMLGMTSDYIDDGKVDAGTIIANALSGAVKGVFVSCAYISPGNKYITTASGRMAANWALGVAVGTGYDYVESEYLLPEKEFNPIQSASFNGIISSFAVVGADPVNMAAGTYLLEVTDLILQGNLSSIYITRNYQSTRKETGWMGKGWTFLYENRLYADGNILHVQLPDGYCVAFACEKPEDGQKQTYRNLTGNNRYSLSANSFKAEWDIVDRITHTIYRYGEGGFLHSVIDRNGLSISFAYENGYPTQMHTPAGDVISFVFSNGKLTELRDQHGRAIQYRYQNDHLTEVVQMDGGVSRYEYSKKGYLTKRIDPSGVSPIENQYDEKGRVVLQTLLNGDTYRMEYVDHKRQMRLEYSAYPGVRCYTHDEKMMITQILYPDGSREEFAYDEFSNRIQEVDRLGRVTLKEYDETGHLIKENRPEGLKIEHCYNESGDREYVRDNAGRERRFACDDRHNLILVKEKISDQKWTERRFSYDALGRIDKETDANGNVTVYGYEGQSFYPSVVTYADGSEKRFQYDPMGRTLSETDGSGITEYGYNKGNYRTVINDGEGNETRMLYDEMGRVLSFYRPVQWKEKKGVHTSYRYDFFGRLIDTVYPDGSHERLLRDGEGNILKKVHPNAYEEKTKDGEGTYCDYDGENRLLRIHYPDGGVERFFYDGAGNRIKHVLPEQYEKAEDDGKGWSYTYDAGNRLTSVTGPDGVVEHTYVYDLWGNCVQKTDEKGCSTYYTYDLKGRLTGELVPVGENAENVSYRKTSYEYDDNGNRIREVRYGGNYGAGGEFLRAGEDLILTFAYDAKNRLTRVEDGLGARISYQYDAGGNRTYEEQVVRSGEELSENGVQERPVLKKIRYSYDRAGRLIRKSEILDDGLSENTAKAFMTAVTSYGYDANGNRISIITPEGYHISRSYDDRDRLITERVEDKKNDIDRTTCISYDKAGNITSVRQSGRDGQAREIAYDYDLKDRLVHAGELDGPVFELIYDKNDRRTEQKQLLPMDEENYEKTEFRYDLRGNLLERYRNDILLEESSYDIRGNRLRLTDGDGVEAGFCYGIQNERLEASTGNSRKQGRAVQRLAYDARGRITGIEDGCGGCTSYQMDAWGRITGINNAEGSQEQYAYDQAGNITETVDARGGKICYAYNSMGKVCAITDQLGNTETFRYDKEGRQIQHTDRRGILTETRYNVYGQPVMQVCTDKKGNRHVMGTWEYDDLGQLKKSVAGGFSYTYLYRPDGKLVKKWSSGKPVISCTYYKNGVLKSLTDVSGKTLHYDYDEGGRLSSLTDDEGKILTEYAYTAAGRVKEVRTPKGFCTVYEYDCDGNLSHLRIGNEEKGSLLYDAFMLYDLNGNRTERKGGRLGADGKMQEIDTVYSYDRMNRLTEERRITDGDRYSYDPAGNRIRKQHYHHALNSENNFSSDSAATSRMIDAEETYCYNERNELTKRKTLSEMTEYLYDENGSLVREKEGSRTASYQYDLLNRQTHVKTFDGREQENLYDGEGLRAGLKENGKRSTFLYYNGEILAECGGGNIEDSVPVRRYQRGISLFQVEDTATGINHTYSQDEQKSTVYITRNDGEVENCYAYDAFGNILESRENIENRIRYTGQQHDQVTGQHYLRARYYNPVIGRFIQEDTYRGDGLNLYAYCGNNPVRYHDPSGRYEQEYSDDFTTESGQSRVEQVDGEFDSGANETGSLNFEVGDNIVNPKDINFMQSSIKNQTGEYTVLGNAEALRNGTLQVTDLPEIRIWQDEDGKLWTLDHRRLAAFRIAELDSVPFRWATNEEVASQMWKMTTKTNGTSVKLKLGNGESIIIQ